MSGVPWTDEELDVIRKLVDKGHGMETITEVLPGRSRDAILNIMRKHKIYVKRTIPPINYELFDIAMEETKCEQE